MLYNVILLARNWCLDLSIIWYSSVLVGVAHIIKRLDSLFSCNGQSSNIIINVSPLDSWPSITINISSKASSEGTGQEANTETDQEFPAASIAI